MNTDDKALPKEILERLRARVFAAGSYLEVCARTGIPLGTLQKMMRGASEPRFTLLCKLASGLDFSLDWLVSGVEIGTGGWSGSRKPDTCSRRMRDSAIEIRGMVSGLPVGGDIRKRLTGAVDAHIAQIEKLESRA